MKLEPQTFGKQYIYFGRMNSVRYILLDHVDANTGKWYFSNLQHDLLFEQTKKWQNIMATFKYTL